MAPQTPQSPTWRDRLETGPGKWATVLVALVVLVWAGYRVATFFGRSPLAAANDRMFVCSETGKAFSHTIKVGEMIPIHSPYSGKDTGYPATACYWTTDGQVKKDPSWVLMNNYLRKPGPTFCQDCGRLVTGRQPKPKSGDTPPPTRDEYYRLHPNDPRN